MYLRDIGEGQFGKVLLMRAKVQVCVCVTDSGVVNIIMLTASESAYPAVKHS